MESLIADYIFNRYVVSLQQICVEYRQNMLQFDSLFHFFLELRLQKLDQVHQKQKIAAVKFDHQLINGNHLTEGIGFVVNLAGCKIERLLLEAKIEAKDDCILQFLEACVEEKDFDEFFA